VGKSLLVVEDEAVIAMDLSNKLEEMGYEVVGRADTSEKAVRIAREKRPDLILMDVRIKGPVDGIDTAAIIRRERKIPVVFLTSFSDEATVSRAALTAPYGYLTKPYKVKELRAAIEVALQKAALERQLQESERWFASALRCSSDGIVVAGPDGMLRFLNPAAERLTGWTFENAKGRHIDEVVCYVDSDTNGAATVAAARALGANHVTEVVRGRPLVKRDGSTVPVDESAAPLLDDNGESVGSMVILRDATARLAQEQRLRGMEDRFRGEVDMESTGVAVVSLSGSFIRANEALARLLGYRAEELAGASEDQLTHPDDIEAEREQLFELLADAAAVVHFDKRYWYRDCTRAVWVSASASLMTDNGEAVGYTFQVHDIGHRKAVEAERARAATATSRRN
jgi:PAS domain S-box-containing protein